MVWNDSKMDKSKNLRKLYPFLSWLMVKQLSECRPNLNQSKRVKNWRPALMLRPDGSSLSVTTVW